MGEIHVMGFFEKFLKNSITNRRIQQVLCKGGREKEIKLSIYQ